MSRLLVAIATGLALSCSVAICAVRSAPQCEARAGTGGEAGALP
jgi:hypothetical protein